jgi:hypothetical protein
MPSDAMLNKQSWSENMQKPSYFNEFKTRDDTDTWICVEKVPGAVKLGHKVTSSSSLTGALWKTNARPLKVVEFAGLEKSKINKAEDTFNTADVNTTVV